jgi:gliding motility-associated-like protein
MDKNLHQLDKRFQDAFGGYEAPYSASDMQADWSQVSAQLPQAPVVQPPVKAPVWGAGKVLSIAGAAAIATTTAVLLYNTLTNKSAVTEQDNKKPATEQLAQNPILQPENSSSENSIDPGQEDYNAVTSNSETHTASNVPKLPFKKGSSQSDGGGSNPLPNTIPNSGNETSGNLEDETGIKNNPQQNQPQPEIKVLPDQREIYFTDTIICAGGEIEVENLSSVVSDKIILEWGDGEWTKFGKSHKHVYANSGRYTVKILHGDEVIKKSVDVEKVPSLIFNTRCEGLKCSFRNASESNLSWSWDFGDGTPARAGYSQDHQYRDTGRYRVTLTGVTKAGCTSSVTKLVYIKPSPDVPNVITPNDDGYNDRLVIGLDGETYYSLVIYSADNREVFRSEDKNKQWDGKDSRGQVCKPGTYYYLLQYKYRGDNEIRQSKGMIMIAE